MDVQLTIMQAAEQRGIKTQKELLTVIERETGFAMRPSTLSAMIRNSQTTVNRTHLATIMRALAITDFNEVCTLNK